MTQKSCSRCVWLRGQNIERTGRICAGMPIANQLLQPVIKTASLDTFYCAAFHPEELREAEKKQPTKDDFAPQTREEELMEERNLPPIQRRFV